MKIQNLTEKKMIMDKKYFRSTKKVLDEDLIFPHSGGLLVPDFDQQRNLAILEVLRRIPEKDYQELVKIDEKDLFQWFIPHYEEFALCYPFPITHPEEPFKNLTFKDFTRVARAEVLYLSPLLEEQELEIVIAVIAHELAHIVLGHQTIFVEDYETQEKEAWELINKWGFKKELRKYKIYRKKEEKERQEFIRKHELKNIKKEE